MADGQRLWRIGVGALLSPFICAAIFIFFMQALPGAMRLALGPESPANELYSQWFFAVLLLPLAALPIAAFLLHVSGRRGFISGAAFWVIVFSEFLWASLIVMWVLVLLAAGAGGD